MFKLIAFIYIIYVIYVAIFEITTYFRQSMSKTLKQYIVAKYKISEKEVEQRDNTEISSNFLDMDEFNNI